MTVSQPSRIDPLLRTLKPNATVYETDLLPEPRGGRDPQHWG
jgi:hypothetical protein